MPREAQLSTSPSFSFLVPLVTIENSRAPAADASLAAFNRAEASSIGYSGEPVEYLTDWAQKEQSSLQRPLLAFTIEQRLTSTPLWRLLTRSVTARRS